MHLRRARRADESISISAVDHARFPYVLLDADYQHLWLGKRRQVISRASVVAIAVNENGRDELLGLKMGYSKSERFWRNFNPEPQRGEAVMIQEAPNAQT